VVHLPSLALFLWLLTGRGPAGAALALVLAALASGSVALPVALRILGVPLREFVGSLAPQLAAAVLMAVVVHGLRLTLRGTPDALALLVMVPSGVLVYGAALYVLGRDRWRELLHTARDAVAPARSSG